MKQYTITLPDGKELKIGPGAVPTAPDSLKETDMEKMRAASKIASKAGVSDKKEDYGIYIPFPATK